MSRPSTNGSPTESVSAKPSGPLEGPEREALEASLAGAKEENAQLAADFARFKARTQRDFARLSAEAKEAFIRELLPVLDNLERALAPEVAAASPEALQQGVELTVQQLTALLMRHGIEPTEDIGRAFDPHSQEAISVWHDPSQPDQFVLAVAQRGYRRGGDSFRPAKVVVNDLGRIP